MTAVRRPNREYVAYLCLGLILGAVAYIVVGALWLGYWAWANALAG